jgi:hypothetical protein
MSSLANPEAVDESESLRRTMHTGSWEVQLTIPIVKEKATPK